MTENRESATAELIAPSHVPTISFEYFPPKDDASELALWTCVDELARFNADFVTVTYGAGGSTQDRTIRIARSMFERTNIPTIAHLTCVNATQEQLSDVIEEFQAAGISGILALRGDPAGGPTTPWVSTPGGFDYASQLVSLINAKGGFDIGVAAFPDIHPASFGNFDQDIDVLLEKEANGATFAVTQFVFDSSRYERLVNALQARGSKLSVYPGIMPVTNYMQLNRMLELSGGYMPTATRMRFARYQNDVKSLRALGVEIATQICEEVYALGAEGFHFYTLNNAEATSAVIDNLSMLSGRN